MESELVNYRIVISHDCHGDILGVELWADDEMKNSAGYSYTGYQITINRAAYYGGPMFRLFNAIVKGADLM